MVQLPWSAKARYVRRRFRNFWKMKVEQPRWRREHGIGMTDELRDDQRLPPTQRNIQNANLLAAEQYRPARPFEGQIVWFRALERRQVWEDEALKRWQHYATAGLNIIDVPGEHHTILQRPYVETLAERMQEVINKALAAVPES